MANEPGWWRRIAPAAPLHPIFVHFTIASTAASLLFDMGAKLIDDPSLASAGWWTLLLAAVVTPVTVVTGLVSRARVEMGESRARSYLRLHMAVGPVFLGLLLGVVFWRFALWSERRIPDWLYLAALAAVNAIMLVQGYLGGELVYRWGADVRGVHPRLRQDTAHTRPPRPGL